MYTSADDPNPGTAPDLDQVDPPHPWRSALTTVVVAAVIVTAAIAAYVYFGRKPPVASGQVSDIRLYPVHTTTSGGGAQGMQGAGESYDQSLVFAHILVHNQTKIPLFLAEIAATLTLPDGSELSSLATGVQDYDRVFQAYPDLASWRAEPLRRDITINPGQSVEGLAIFNYPVSKEQWDQRRKLDVRISFIHQNDLVIPTSK